MRGLRYPVPVGLIFLAVIGSALLVLGLLMATTLLTTKLDLQSTSNAVGILIATGIGLSGWGTVTYSYFTDKPKLGCRIFTVIVGNFTFAGRQYTSFLTYLYLTNRRRAAIYVLDYGMEVEIDGQFRKLDRAYGTHKVQNWTLTDSSGNEIKIPELNHKWIYVRGKPAEYANPLHGFVLFVGDPSYHDRPITRYRISCEDAFGSKHTFVIKAKDLPNLYLFADIAGVELPPRVGLPKIPQQ